MSVIKEQAVQMISDLSDDNVVFLVELMKRFMIPKEAEVQNKQNKTITSHADFMQDLETMRIKMNPYFPSDLETEKIWEEAMDEKYNSFG